MSVLLDGFPSAV